MFFFQTLEDDFAFQLEEQERHYGPYLNSALSAEAAAAEGRNSATPTDGRRGSQPSRKASSKSSGSERSAGSGSRKSSVNETSKFHHHRHSGGYMHSGQRRLSASRHSLASRGSDLWFLWLQVFSWNQFHEKTVYIPLFCAFFADIHSIIHPEKILIPKWLSYNNNIELLTTKIYYYT